MFLVYFIPKFIHKFLFVNSILKEYIAGFTKLSLQVIKVVKVVKESFMSANLSNLKQTSEIHTGKNNRDTTPIKAEPTKAEPKKVKSKKGEPKNIEAKNSKESLDSENILGINFKNLQERELFKKQLVEICKTENSKCYSSEEIKNYAIACDLLQKYERDLNVITSFFQHLFKNVHNRQMLADLLLTLNGRADLKFTILSLWMEHPLEINQLKKEHTLMFLQLLKSHNYVPARFDPAATNSFLVILSAKALHLFEEGEIDNKTLSDISYITFLLGASLQFPVKEFSEDMVSAIKQYTPIAKKMGYCDANGNYYTKKLDPTALIYKAIAHPSVVNISNFFRALFLIQYLNLEVLPNLLNRLEKVGPLKDFQTNLKEYYRHMVQVFIPNLFNIIRHPKVRADFRIVHQLSKFLLEFPVEWYPQIKHFVSELTEECLINIENLMLSEVFHMLKLNDFVEIRHREIILNDLGKKRIMDYLILNRGKLDAAQIEALMQLRFSLLKNFIGNFKIFEVDFNALVKNKASQFKGHANICLSEKELFHFLLNHLSPENKRFLKLNFICEKTGKEIDIVFIKDSTRVAIHADGAAFHHYLDRTEENRKTLIRNQVLINAGWINVVQTLPAKFTKGLHEEKKMLLEKLKSIIPLKGFESVYVVPGKMHTSASYALSSSISNDISSSQIATLLAVGHPTLIDDGVARGLRNRFMIVQQILSGSYPGFIKMITKSIAQYQLPHPEEPEFATIEQGSARLRNFFKANFIKDEPKPLLLAKKTHLKNKSNLMSGLDDTKEKTVPGTIGAKIPRTMVKQDLSTNLASSSNAGPSTSAALSKEMSQNIKQNQTRTQNVNQNQTNSKKPDLKKTTRKKKK